MIGIRHYSLEKKQIYGWEGKTNADESLQSLSHRQ